MREHQYSPKLRKTRTARRRVTPEDSVAAEKARKRLIDVVQQLEQKRQSRIWLHIDGDHLCSPSLRGVLKERVTLRTIKKLEIVLHSPGGHPEIAYKIMRYLRRTIDEVNI